MLSRVVASFPSSLPTITVDWKLAFERPETQAAAAYWNTLCGNRLMPSRAELKPGAMRRFLQYVSLVDIDPETGLYTVNLQSGHAHEVFGNLGRSKFAELFPPDVAQRWRDCFNLVRDGGRSVRLATQVGTQGKLWLDCETFIAPLSDSPEGVRLASLFWVFVSWKRDKGTATG